MKKHLSLIMAAVISLSPISASLLATGASAAPADFSTDFTTDEGYFTEEDGIDNFIIANGTLSTSAKENAVTYIEANEKNAGMKADLTYAGKGDFGFMLRCSDGAYVKAGYNTEDGKWYIECADGNASDVRRMASAVMKLSAGKTCTAEFKVFENMAALTVDGEELLRATGITAANAGKAAIFADNCALTVDNLEYALVTEIENTYLYSFTDVHTGLPYYNAVKFAVDEGLFNGTSATTFDPDVTMNRAMFVTVLGRLSKADVSAYTTPTFDDVKAGQWYTSYVEWAAANGIVNGMGGGIYGVTGTVTVEQACTILARYADFADAKNEIEPDNKNSVYADKDNISDWAKAGVEWAIENNIYTGSGYALNPTAPASRALVAMMFANYVKAFS